MGRHGGGSRSGGSSRSSSSRSSGGSRGSGGSRTRTSKKPFRKPSHSRNIASGIKPEETAKTEVEQNDTIVAPLEKEQSTKKRKFPTVKRNK